MGVCPHRGHRQDGGTGASAEEVRKRRLAKLSAPGDLDDSWQCCFLSGGLPSILKSWRKMHFPIGAMLLLVIEGPEDSVETQKLQKFLWPALAKDILSATPTSTSRVLAARLGMGRLDPRRASGDDDAGFLLKLFGLGADAVPVAFFLWGVPQVRAVRLGGETSPSSFRKLVADMQEHAKRDWLERGWEETVDGATGQRIVSVSDLERRRPLEELHVKMAEDLLAAYSTKQAQELMRRGVAAAGDFVVEDVAVGLETDAIAAEARAFHVAEQAERESLRLEQAKEFDEAQAADRQWHEEEEQRRAAADRLEEEAEAMAIWAEMDRAQRLTKLPPEPADNGSGTRFLITLTLPSSGRRLTRSWRGEDSVSDVANFAFGSAVEQELPYAGGLPLIQRGFPRRDLAADQRLDALGLEAREVLYVGQGKP